MLVQSGVTRSATFVIGGKRLTYAPLRRQSRLLDELVEQDIWRYEPELAHFVFANPFGYANFVDGGAHIALYSTMAACSGKYERITAIEAAPDTAAYVRAFKQRNGLDFTLVECALGDSDGTVTFEIPETGYVMPSHSALSVSTLYRNQKKRSVQVRSRPLAEFLEAKATLVKLDCEGSEEEILSAARDSLKARQDIDFIVEIMINDANKGAVFDLIRSAGYQAYLMTNGRLVRDDRIFPLSGRPRFANG